LQLVDSSSRATPGQTVGSKPKKPIKISGYDDPSSASNFFKIAAIPGCGAADGLNIPSSVTMAVQLPAELPPCEHCVLRWEWTGHQQAVRGGGEMCKTKWVDMRVVWIGNGFFKRKKNAGNEKK
jgi:hypothetical protein